MVNFFEEITEELNDYERLTISPLIVKGLSKKIGKENVITNGEMRKALLNKYSIKISDARMRKIIQYIRLGGFVERLIATSKGYYVSENKEELLQYEESIEATKEQYQDLFVELESIGYNLEVLNKPQKK